MARSGEFYWSPEGFRDAGRFRALADGPWVSALIDFLIEFAFERQGAARDYARATIAAIEQHAGEVPDEQLERDAWHSFCERQGKTDAGEGLNRKLQPLAPGDGKISICAFVASLGEYDYNIMRWAVARIRAGDLRGCWQDLQHVRGIGPKLAAFYLRDVITAHELDETELEPVCFQPIDIWTRRGAQAFAPLVGLPAPGESGGERVAAAILVEIARRAEALPSLINAGLWVIGSQILGSNLAFDSTLTNRPPSRPPCRAPSVGSNSCATATRALPRSWASSPQSWKSRAGTSSRSNPAPDRRDHRHDSASSSATDSGDCGVRNIETCIVTRRLSSPGHAICARNSVVALVAVAEQAVVARCLAPFAYAGGVFAVLASVRVEVADRQGLARDLGQLGRVVQQPPQNAGAALGGFEEHQQPSERRCRQWLGGELLLLELEDGLLRSHA